MFFIAPPDLDQQSIKARAQVANAVFMMLVQHCRDFKLPFALMIGVNRAYERLQIYNGAQHVTQTPSTNHARSDVQLYGRRGQEQYDFDASED